LKGGTVGMKEAGLVEEGWAKEAAVQGALERGAEKDEVVVEREVEHLQEVAMLA